MKKQKNKAEDQYQTKYLSILFRWSFLFLFILTTALALGYFLKVRKLEIYETDKVRVFDGEFYNDYELILLNEDREELDEFGVAWRQSVRDDYNERLELGRIENRKNFNTGVYVVYMAIIELGFFVFIYYTNQVKYNTQGLLIRKINKLTGALVPPKFSNLYSETQISFGSIDKIEIRTKAEGRTYKQKRKSLGWQDVIVIKYQSKSQKKVEQIRYGFFSELIELLDYIHENHKDIKFSFSK